MIINIVKQIIMEEQARTVKNKVEQKKLWNLT